MHPVPQTEAERERHPCYVAYCNCGCGRISYANATDKLTAAEQREIGKMVSEGYRVERTTVKAAREGKWFCETKRKAEAEAEAQGALL